MSAKHILWINHIIPIWIMKQISIILPECEGSSSQLMKVKLHNLKQHWIRNQMGNLVIREIFRSSDEVYHKDGPESMHLYCYPNYSKILRYVPFVLLVHHSELLWFKLLHNEYSWLLLGTLCPLFWTAETISTVCPVCWHKRNTFIYSLSSKVYLKVLK